MKDTLRPGIRHTMAYAVPEHRTVPNLLPESADFAAMQRNNPTWKIAHIAQVVLPTLRQAGVTDLDRYAQDPSMPLLPDLYLDP